MILAKLPIVLVHLVIALSAFVLALRVRRYCSCPRRSFPLFADPGLAIISNSRASGSVTEYGGGLAGGLVGQSATYSVLTPTLLSDDATGSVTGTGGDGGLAGHVNSGLVQGSYATGSSAGVSAIGDSTTLNPDQASN